MKQFYYTLGISVMFVWGLMLLMTWTPTVQAQTNPNAPAAPNAVYLPLIAGGTGISRIKTRSGIHMGNRGIGSDWPTTVFQLITGTTQGIFPAATVVQSAQLFNFIRSSSLPCRIDRVAEVRAPNLYNYLNMAIHGGTMIIVRITPSPGNFTDDVTHTLKADEAPAGGNYCNPGDKTPEKFRDILDITNEMTAVYTWATQIHWPTDQLYFEPANEPNNEWYSKNITITRQLQRSEAWKQMDDYFSKLYDRAHSQNDHLQILAPAMGQRNFAETMYLGNCGFMPVDGVNGKSGYDFMLNTYRSTRFEGYSWHNYWNYDTEGIDEHLNVDYCFAHANYVSSSQHLFQYFPDWLRWQIKVMKDAGKPTFITEADLNSRCQDSSNPVQSKVLQWEETKSSLNKFIANEALAEYVVAWLLVQEDDGQNSDCAVRDPNYEIYLHEAYFESNHLAFVNKWFSEWWLNDKP